MYERPACARLFLVLICVLCFCSCEGKSSRHEPPESSALEADVETDTAAAGAPEPRRDPYTRLYDEALQIVLTLDDSLLAAQCLLSGLDNTAAVNADVSALFQKIPPGGIMLFGTNLDAGPEAAAALVSGYSALVAGAAGIPPFMAVDHEGGTVHRFGSSVTKIPAAASFWDMARNIGGAAALAELEEQARVSGAELRALGINLNLAPVAEVLTEENAAFLGTRSFGPDPAFVAGAAAAFVRGMAAAGIACTLKHFPGSGGSDPHVGAGEISADAEALAEMVLPFRELARAGTVSAVMVSHAVLPSVDPLLPASLSGKAVSAWLKGELGFTGIAIADDLAMGAVSAFGLAAPDTAVAAVNAGIDMIMCWPQNMTAIHAALVSALADGRIPRERLRDAAARVIAEKLKYGLYAETQNREKHDEGSSF